ncbi:MAG: FkbM family methyltransferase, partial [Magnetococcales bacterium]|nr:FkbM family methyltransferase [Magnetococcales bacterium]
VFDIGANLGYYAIMEHRIIGPTGKMVVIEPSPRNRAILKLNLEMNGYHHVPMLPCAVSDQCSQRSFYLAAETNLNTFHPTGSATTHLTGQVIEVETTTVPIVAQQYGAPDLIRMDVEGHEVEVLRGLLPAVQDGSMKPMILFETHLSRYTPDHDLAPVLRELFRCGYRVTMAASSGESGTAKVESLGYRGSAPFETDFMYRVLFGEFRNDDAEELICRSGGLRTVLLSCTDPDQTTV